MCIVLKRNDMITCMIFDMNLWWSGGPITPFYFCLRPKILECEGANVKERKYVRPINTFLTLVLL